ncbi:MAG: hypothetical protein ACR2PO_17955 [Methyloligellaceae bacterium]
MNRFALLIACLVAALVLSGCSRRQKTPEPKQTGVQRDGSYIVSERERTEACGRLTNNALGHVDAMKKHAAAEKANRSTERRSVFSRFRRSRRPDSENVQQYKWNYSIVVAINKVLDMKGCASLDVATLVKDDAELMGVKVEKK